MSSFIGLTPASEASSWAKRMNGAADTQQECVLRSLLWRRGLRFRKNVRSLPGRPDIVFPKARTVVFCDGDFWHGKRWSELRPKLDSGTNGHYWTAKIARNRERDQQVNKELEHEGWLVIRFWEGDILRNPARVAAKIHRIVTSRLQT